MVADRSIGGRMPCRSCSWGPSAQGQQQAHNSSHCLGMAGAGGGAPAHPQGDPPTPRVVGGLSPPLPPRWSLLSQPPLALPPSLLLPSAPSVLISSFCSWRILVGPGPCDHLSAGSLCEPMQVGVSRGAPSLPGVSAVRRSLCSVIAAAQSEQGLRHSAFPASRKTEAPVVSPARLG